MSSLDESLKKHFTFEKGSIDDLIEWLKKLQVFEKTNIRESDVRESYNKIKSKISAIKFEDFLNILVEIARRTQTKLEELKAQLVQQMDNYENLEVQFYDNLKKGEATFQDVMDWMERNEIFDKMKLVEEDAKEAFNSMKQKATNYNYEDLVQGLMKLAAKYNINVQELIRKLTDPGFMQLNRDKDGAGKSGQ